MQKPTHHIFVCGSARLTGTNKGYCSSKGANDLIQLFLEEINDRGLEDDVMVTMTGCLGICAQGPVVIVYPEGVWYKGVQEKDVYDILDQHIENGEVVERLVI